MVKCRATSKGFKGQRILKTELPAELLSVALHCHIKVRLPTFFGPLPGHTVGAVVCGHECERGRALVCLPAPEPKALAAPGAPAIA